MEPKKKEKRQDDQQGVPGEVAAPLIAKKDFVIWQPPVTPAPIEIKKGDDVSKLNLSLGHLENLKTEQVI